MDAWVTVKVRKSLVEKIDPFVGVKNKHGTVDYESRGQIAEEALVDWLKKHEKLAVVEVKA